jgi:hypothetical protein
LDLAHTDALFFPKLKENIWGQTSVLFTKSWLQYASGFGRKEKTFGIQKLVKQWQKGIEVGGDHVKN